METNDTLTEPSFIKRIALLILLVSSLFAPVWAQTSMRGLVTTADYNNYCVGGTAVFFFEDANTDGRCPENAGVEHYEWLVHSTNCVVKDGNGKIISTPGAYSETIRIEDSNALTIEWGTVDVSKLTSNEKTGSVYIQCTQYKGGKTCGDNDNILLAIKTPLPPNLMINWLTSSSIDLCGVENFIYTYKALFSNKLLNPKISWRTYTKGGGTLISETAFVSATGDALTFVAAKKYSVDAVLKWDPVCGEVNTASASAVVLNLDPYFTTTYKEPYYLDDVEKPTFTVSNGLGNKNGSHRWTIQYGANQDPTCSTTPQVFDDTDDFFHRLSTLKPTFSCAGDYTVKVEIPNENCPGGVSFPHTWNVKVLKRPTALCEIIVPLNAKGKFDASLSSGAVVFTPATCGDAFSVGCLSLQSGEMSNVVAASATRFDDTEKLIPEASSQGGANPFVAGYRGKWRPVASYAYRTQLNLPPDASDMDAGQALIKNYREGTFTASTFNWQATRTSASSPWLAPGQVTRYSPQGEGLEEVNILNIYSTVKIGYDHSLPYLTAQNARYDSVLFESFERTYTKGGQTSFEDGLAYTNDLGQVLIDTYQDSYKNEVQLPHSGHRYLNLTNSKLTLKPLDLTGNAFRLSVWLKSSALITQKDVTDNVIIEVGNSTKKPTLIVIARTGDWILCEAIISANEVDVPSVGQSLVVTPAIKCLDKTIGIDDVRVQPLLAQMIAYVYDYKTLRVMASFDDQHFGLYYQYNDEGQLVRKQVETERGVKTIQETQYNTPQLFTR